MAGRLSINTLKSLASKAPKDPASAAALRRMLSEAAATGKTPADGESDFEKIWIKRDVYPIIFVVGAGCFYCAWTVRTPPTRPRGPALARRFCPAMPSPRRGC